MGVLNDNQNFGDLNGTNIVLILKVKNLTSMANFRPISLCNVIYKNVIKMIANMFQKVLNDCIDSYQSTFVPIRLISNNTMLAYELMHYFGQKRSGAISYGP